MDGDFQRQWCLGKFGGRSQDIYNRDGIWKYSILLMWKPWISGDLTIRFCCFGYRPLKTPCSFENQSIDLHSPCWKLQWSIQWWVFQFLCQSKRGLPGAMTNTCWEEKGIIWNIFKGLRRGWWHGWWAPEFAILTKIWHKKLPYINQRTIFF